MSLRDTLGYVAALLRINLAAGFARPIFTLASAAMMLGNNVILFLVWVIYFANFSSLRGWGLQDLALLIGVVAWAFGLTVFLAGGIRDLAATIADGADTFEVVQVSDYVVGTVTATERAVPGDGDIPLERFIAAVCDAGFTGPFELEMLGPRVESEGYGPSVARAIKALDPMIEAASK